MTFEQHELLIATALKTLIGHVRDAEAAGFDVSLGVRIKDWSYGEDHAEFRISRKTCEMPDRTVAKPQSPIRVVEAERPA